MTLLIVLTTDYATATVVRVVEDSIAVPRERDTHLWEFTGTDSTSTLTVTLVCGNTSNPSKSLDPVLRVDSPSITKINDDGFTSCDFASSSIVTFSAGQVEDGIWITEPRGFSTRTGPYTLTLTLVGPGQINQIVRPAPTVVTVESSIGSQAEVDTHFWEFRNTSGFSSLTVTLVCGNTSNPSESLDPLLRVFSPSILRANDDGFTSCDRFRSSIVSFSISEVEDGCWTTESQAFQGFAVDTTGPYTLTLSLVGGQIRQIQSCDDIGASRGGGGSWEDPSLGPDSGGIVKHSNGICINITCWDVTQNYHVDFELYEMLTGSNTISLTIWCPHGVATCNYVGLGIMPPNEKTSSSIWSFTIEKSSSGEWKLIKDDSEGRLGNITFTVQEVGTQFLTVSFSLDFKNLSTDKMWLWVELRDTSRGVNLFIFNDGVKFIDIDAYPEVQTAFEPSLKLELICLDEDPTYRYSCAFAENRDLATQLAEDTLRQMLNGEYIYK